MYCSSHDFYWATINAILLICTYSVKSLGVPVSSQWSDHGYFYAIQIAQFGLSHYCKELLGSPPKFTLFENGENGIQVSGNLALNLGWYCKYRS